MLYDVPGCATAIAFWISSRAADDKASDEQFIEDILENDLIVCVLTGNNPNVYYELAIAESALAP